MGLYGPATVLRTPDYAVYCARHLAFATDRQQLPTKRAGTIAVYANEGRWLADCPYCNAGMISDQAWPDIRCFGCSSIYALVAWPEQVGDIEAELLVRPITFQNWKTGESLAQLSRENLDHGFESAFLTAQLLDLGVKVG